MVKNANFPSLDVLVVDDDQNILKTLLLSLKSLGCTAVAASSAEKALAELRARRFDLVLTDFRMEGMTGLDLVREARTIAPRSLCVVMTAYASFENAVAAIKEGAFDYLPKPFSVDQLEHLLRKVGAVASLARENERLRAGSSRADFFEGATSEAAVRLEEFVNAVAPTEATVLISGETGTGKTEIARLIHERSPRRDKPLVEVTCTSIAETLFESEVFGHVKGAFTGAVKDHVGKFELADGGTLVLDEIGDLSPALQSKLLRFLEARVIERVGGSKPIALDVRIIAATNKDLPRLVREGGFREDLYYRLNVFEVVLPPLRRRKEDLPALAVRLLRQASARAGLAEPPELEPEVMAALLEHCWPGNVRELRNVMERAALLARGRPIRPDDLPPSVRERAEALEGRPERLLTLEEVEVEHIKKVLAVEKNQERAARILGVNPVTLWRKRKEYGLP